MRYRVSCIFLLILCTLFASCSTRTYKPEYIFNSIAASPSGSISGCGNNGLIAFTEDLKRWDYMTINENIKFFDMVYFNDSFVILGTDTSIGKNVLCFYRPDLKGWDVNPHNEDIMGIEEANNHLFIITRDTVKMSDDGTDWEDIHFPVQSETREEIRNIPECIIFDGKNYIVTGGGNFIATSSDLKTWDFKVENGMGSGCSYGAATNGKTNVVVGDKLFIAFSEKDRNEWSANYSGDNIKDIKSVADYYTLCIFDVASDGNKFVAVGARSLILHSTDGVHWTIADINQRSWLRKIIWNGKRFIALGDDSIVTSPDGENWTVLRH